MLSYYLFMHNITKKPSFAISKSLNAIGGKETFVYKQEDAWIEEDISVYINWFSRKLVLEAWVVKMNFVLK